MSELTGPWVAAWRLNRNTLNPEQVRIMPVSPEFVLVEGESHTVYRGGFFDTPEQAFKHEYEENARHLRYAEQRKERIDRARARYEEGAIK